MTLDIQQLTGLGEREGNQVLLNEYAKRTGAHWWLEEAPSRLPVGILVEFNAPQFYDWPSRDLNLMALIVAAMGKAEKRAYLKILKSCFRKDRPNQEQMDQNPFWEDNECLGTSQEDWEWWLATASKEYRFVAAILALKLGRN